LTPTDLDNENDRQQKRLAIAVEVEYRTAGAFLVAYSVNLSAGGMFVETPKPLPIDTPLSLKFAVPGSESLEVQGIVAWVRDTPSTVGPAGMGVRFADPLETRYGELIDRLVERFRGIHVLVFAPGTQGRGRLIRALRSMLSSAHVIEIADSTAFEEAMGREADLALIEFDEAEEADALVALRLAKVGPRPMPAIVAAPDDELRNRARSLGADEVVTNPPAFTELQAAVIRALGRPSRIS
jgi:uncharacterized protein (TIGR02266 family)